jgi:hypothetical protein
MHEDILTVDEVKQAIRHLRYKLVQVWCEKPLKDPEAKKMRAMLLAKINKLKEEL